MTELFAFITLLLVAAVLASPWAWGRWRRLRQNQWRAQPFPRHWFGILRRRVPLYRRLPADLQIRLRQEMLVFLAEKPLVGCAGLRITDEMRVTIAAQACLLLLGARRGGYPELREVLVYPDAFVVQARDGDASVPGLHHEWEEARSGESSARGQVVLSWADVKAGSRDPDDGFNVVIHEFAHQLDQVKGYANGAPPLPSAQAYALWSGVMQAEYDALHARLRAGQQGLLDPYAATAPAEFFAVASETFFERPQALAEQHPALYQQLSGFYRLNPLSWA
jgi:Mlc titration factor MtfA (ptsG expression regulator)